MSVTPLILGIIEKVLRSSKRPGFVLFAIIQTLLITRAAALSALSARSLPTAVTTSEGVFVAQAKFPK